MPYRSIGIDIDLSTWPRGQPAPPSFVGAASHFNVNIPTLLLLIGFLTTPSHAAGITLSEFWAWVRYLNAISLDPDLRITEDFYQLDAHQKTILSDDFGMGMAVYWLFDKLGLEAICDGRYFIDRVAATTGASVIPTRKRGPTKSPDFVIRDNNGIWHVVECKGTQSGTAYRDRQLGASGAGTQKSTILFPGRYSGQRLGCGLSIARSGSQDNTNLKIIDPPADDEFALGEDQMVYADDAVSRAIGARSLRLSGFGASASAMSAPMGKSPSAMSRQGRADEARQTEVELKRARALGELAEKGARQRFQNAKQKFRGRSIIIDLPMPVVLESGSSRRVRIRNGVNELLLNDLIEDPVKNDLFNKGSTAAFSLMGRSFYSTGKRGAELKIGDIFVSEISFE